MLALRLFVRKFKNLKKALIMSTETWTSVEKLYARTRNNIFKKKRIPNIQILDFESFIF